MILYFSATGNTRYVAELLAERLKDEALDLTRRIKRRDYSALSSDKPFVVCSPIYISMLPQFLLDHLKRQEFAGDRRIYFLFTAAGHAGIAGKLAQQIAREKGLRFMGAAEVRMPNNYVASAFFPMPGKEQIQTALQEAPREIDRIAARIRRGRKIPPRRVSYLEWAGTRAFVPLWTRLMQSSRPFYADSRCIGCGKCVKVCPLNNIRLKEKRPVWKGGPCAHCMACIGNCPVGAIGYGKVTRKRERYHIGEYL